MKHGFSTGDFHRFLDPVNDLDSILTFLYSTGCTAVELNLGGDRLDRLSLTPGLRAKLDWFDYVSIHAPVIAYGDNQETRKTLQKLERIASKTGIDGITVHPDTVEDFTVLDSSSLPFLIENMDTRKASCWTPAEFQELVEQTALGFVLDVQHVYEHDNLMQLGKDLLEVMGDRLQHVHISGETDEKIHAPLFEADNSKTIQSFLDTLPDVPRIDEGTFTDEERFQHRLQEELELLRK